jgi:hypothetical protein
MLQRVIYWGDRDPVEFRAPAKWLEAHCDCRFVPPGGEPEMGDWAPDWIILAQQRPGEFRPCDVERLMARFPLAACIGLLGSWCEGETRTGRPLPGVHRIFWHQWQPRLERFLGGQAPDSPQRLPRTASDVEFAMAGQAGPGSSKLSAVGNQAVISLRTRPTVLVHCSNARWPMFRELLDEWGLKVRRAATEFVDHDPGTGSRDRPCSPAKSSPSERTSIETGDLFYLWDTGPGVVSELDTFAADVRRYRPLGAIVIADFPRWQELLAWTRAGATHLLARPWLLADLIWCLRLLSSGLTDIAGAPANSSLNPAHESRDRQFHHPAAIVPRKPWMTPSIPREPSQRTE